MRAALLVLFVPLVASSALAAAGASFQATAGDTVLGAEAVQDPAAGASGYAYLGTTDAECVTVTTEGHTQVSSNCTGGPGKTGKTI